jgi:threonine aldolase
MRSKQFASDTYAGLQPAVMAALAEANRDHAPAYGEDPWTRRAADRLREVFAADCEVFFCLTGTAANALSLAAMCQSYHSVLAAESAHVETDECGAPEYASNGAKLILLPAPDGRLDPAAIGPAARRRNDLHFPKPRAVTFSNTTELATVYSPGQVAAIGAASKAAGLRLHCDGSRFANAVAANGCHPADLSWRAGVDVLCLGGSKNGAFATEAILFFDRALAKEFEYRCKQAGQLISKMRFAAAPWLALLDDGQWLRSAGHANAMARHLAAAVAGIPGVRVVRPVEANAVFADLAPGLAEAMHARGWHFYNFIGGAHCWMCSWDTTPEDIAAFAADLRAGV